MNTRTVLVGVGANVGDPRRQVCAALDALEALAVRPASLRRSSLWGSRPVDCPPGAPDFVNAVAAFDVEATRAPLDLLDALLAIEAAAGRVRSVRNAPRPLDLDLLLFGGTCCSTERLVLPHPRGHLRAFVLRPAREVAPNLLWPGLARSIAELADALPEAEGLWRLA